MDSRKRLATRNAEWYSVFSCALSFLLVFPVHGLASAQAKTPSYPNGKTWFQASANLGGEDVGYSQTFQLEEVNAYKGSHRLAPEPLPGQTYVALHYAIQGWRMGTDTAFWFHESGLLRKDPQEGLVPVWVQAVRAGGVANESAGYNQAGSPDVLFHNEMYGKGRHALPEGIWLPGQLWVLSMSLNAMPGIRKELLVASDPGEEGYIRKYWKASGIGTEERRIIDEVACRVVRYVREDGATAEFDVSIEGGRILGARTFRGTSFRFIQ